MRIDREEIHENKIVCSNTMQITLDDDFNVPDSKADIETIVKERGSVHIDTVKAVGDRAEVTGGMDFAVLYAGSESGEKSVLPVKMTGTMNIGEVLEEEVVPFFLVVETVLFFCTADIGLLRCGIYFKRSMFLEIGTDYAN